MIIASQISKSYGDSVVIDGVSVSIPAGGVTSIIGPNGAGKSTLLSIVARLMSMDTGTVTVDGLDVTKTPSDTLAKRLSILRQDNHISSRLTVRDLVGFGRYPYSKGRPTIEDKAHIDRALEYLHLENLADRFLDELSGGQRQRVAIERADPRTTDPAARRADIRARRFHPGRNPQPSCRPARRTRSDLCSRQPRSSGHRPYVRSRAGDAERRFCG